MINKALHAAFDQGRAVDLLVGAGADFIPDHGFLGQHDFLLAIDQLPLWTRGSPDRISAATRSLETAFGQLITAGRELDSLRLLWAYTLASDEYGVSLPVNWAPVRQQFATNLPTVGEELRSRIKGWILKTQSDEAYPRSSGSDDRVTSHDEADMNEALMRAAAELAAFVETSDDKTIDQDAAVQALEAFQATLLRGGTAQELASFARVADALRTEAVRRGDQRRAEFFRSFAEALRPSP